MRASTNLTSYLLQIVCASYLWSWLSPPLGALEYVTLCTSGFVDDVTFVPDGQERATQVGHLLRVTHQRAAPVRRRSVMSYNSAWTGRVLGLQ